MNNPDPKALAEERAYTHKATVEVFSNGRENMVSVVVSWLPDLVGEDIEKLGYLPASFSFVEEYIVPAINQALMDWELDPMMKADSPSKRIN